MKAMIIPGNGITDISEHWFPWLKQELEKIGIEVIAKNMPDPDIARKDIWLPFIEQEIGEGDDVILIGHSSGAVAIMKYLETHKINTAVLVAGCYTDLGDEKEKKSGYYENWKWSAIKENAKKIIQFASTNDPWISIEEAHYIRDHLNTEYYEFDNEFHFGSSHKDKLVFPELLEALKKKL